jgi:hypothetical protein
MIVKLANPASYTKVANIFMLDTRLSFAAKGIMAYLLSKPSDWTVRFSDLVEQGPGGEHYVQTALKQLRDAGYARTVQTRVGGRAVGSEWVIYESPELNTKYQNSETAKIGISDQNSEKAIFRQSEIQTVRKSPSIVTTDSLLTTDVLVTTECGARGGKTENEQAEKKTVVITLTETEKQINFNRARRGGDAEVLFSETEWATDFDGFCAEVLRRKSELSELGINFRYYFNMLESWSKSKTVRRQDWISQLLYFINQDISNGKLKVNNGVSRTGHTNTDRAISAMERAARLSNQINRQ